MLGLALFESDCSLYKVLLFTYPRDFRLPFESEMVQLPSRHTKTIGSIIVDQKSSFFLDKKHVGLLPATSEQTSEEISMKDAAKVCAKVCVMVSIVSGLVLFSVPAARAQEVQTGPTVVHEDKHDVSPPLREIPFVAPQSGPSRILLPLRRPMPPHVSVESGPDLVLQQIVGPLVGTTNLLNFDGVSDRDGVAPPDTNASVGATQAVETVNLSYQVFDKNSGSSLFGPAEITSIWTGFGGLCETGSVSDPVVLYDKAAGRWVISIVAFNATFSSNFECVAISTTSDATGSFNRYAFSFGVNLNDYQKIGVWPDAYYLSANIFPNGGLFSGPQACALDRTKMLAGNAATMQCFQRGTADFSLLPSDLDGATAPPAGSPNFFVELGTSTSLNLFKFHVDFTTPANSTFTGPTSITVSSYTDACSPLGTCIQQKGVTQRLDSLGDRLMHRLAYRNFGGHESIVSTHSIANGSSTAVRWYEIRSPNGTPTVFQSGTFAPDNNFRWMPSIGMDQAGDIVLGYSESSTAIFPSIFFTGRLASDSLGTMESEASIQSGLGSQNGNLSRWGDYTSIAIDPSDDCTFWHANEYLPATGSFNWHTRLASFKFASCVPVTPDFTLTATPASQTVTQGNSTTYTATVSAVGGFNGTVTFSASGLPAGATATYSPTSVTTSGSSTLTVTTDATLTPTGTFTITVTGTSGSTVHSTTVSLVVNSNAPDFSISATPASQTVVQGKSTTYTATITAINGFGGAVTFSASGLPTGATASFSPTSVTGSGSSTLTITTASTTPTGTSTITITGTSSSTVHSTTVTLVVNSAADFTISATPASLTVARGTRGIYTVTITAIGGFSGTVTLSVSGLGTGTQARFGTTTITGSGSTTLTVGPSSTATTGTFTLTITGTSGALVHSTTVTLVVT